MKLLIFCFLILTFALPLSGHATDSYTTLAPICSGSLDANSNCSGGTSFVASSVALDDDGLGLYLNNMFKLGIALAGALAVIMIFIGGFQYMLSESFTKKGEGLERIKAALLGLCVALGSYLILSTINPETLLNSELDLANVSVEAIAVTSHGVGTGLNFSSTTPNYTPTTPGTNVAPCTTTDPNGASTGKATVYYVALESDYPPGSDTPFNGQDGTPLKMGSSAFFNAAQIEGTAKFNDGTVLNYSSGSVKNGNYKWKNTSAPYGEGSQGNALVPYRSVAADPAYYSFGQKLYVKELDGMALPDGTTHNGYVTVEDVGSAIKGNARLDIFTGAGKNSSGSVGNLNTITVTKCS